MGTDSELRQRRGTRGGQKTKDAVTGQVVSGEELVTSGLNTLKSIQQSLSSKSSSDGQQASDSAASHPSSSSRLRLAAGLLLLLAGLATRLHRLDQPPGIVFDELHYGKYVAYYMKNLFFFDSQPPLGKQLLAIPAYLAGFDGNFTFDRIGTPYPDNVPVRTMRTAPAVAGALLIPATYWLLLELGVSPSSAAVAGVLILLENALLTQSRFLFLEPFLMLFAVLGLLCLARFTRCQDRPFSTAWFGWLTLGLAFLGAAVTVRYAGFLSLLLGCALILRDFWTLVPRRDVSGRQLAAQLTARCLLMAAVPAAVYLGSFYCHLAVLHRAGGGHDRVMTSAFQASLEDGLATLIKNQPAAVGHGSQVTLRHSVGTPCWLHSHGKSYPAEFDLDRNSSRQQQVSCWSGKDPNNWWIVKDPARSSTRMVPPFRAFRDGDEVQLVHGITGHHLITSDGYRPPMSESTEYQEVSCYTGSNTSLPKLDLWRVELVNKRETDGAWHAITSQVRFVNRGTNATWALKYSGRTLPEWGDSQQEVMADKMVHQEHTVWNVEEHRYTTMESNSEDERQLEVLSSDLIPLTEMRLGFWRKFGELQLKMLFNNQETVQGHTYATDPLEWLTLQRGVAYWVSADSNAQVHLIGNVAVWGAASASLVAYAGLAGFYLLRRRRGCCDIPEGEWSKMCTICRTILAGFLCNYLPYFVIDHTFFLHHYLPAYVFGVMLAACVTDHLLFLASRLWRPVRALLWLGILVWLAACCYTFSVFSAVSYGTTALSPQQIKEMTWRNSWDFIVHKQ